MDKNWMDKNFNMVIKLEVAGEFIYNDVHELNMEHHVDFRNMLLIYPIDNIDFMILFKLTSSIVLGISTLCNCFSYKYRY